MKILNKKLPYSIKRVIPMAMLAGATLFLNPSCKRDEPDDPTKGQGGTTTEQPVMRDVELMFGDRDRWIVDGKNGPDPEMHIADDTIRKYAAMKNIANIYLVPEEKTWNSYGAPQLLALKEYCLKSKLALSPKVRGRGDFNFYPGEASRVPEDSLWYIQNGWTINKQYSR